MSDASRHSGGSGVSPAFHIELRQFPHNLCHFNLTEHELRTTIVEPWAREEWIELGERKWSPHQAKLTVLEGPHLPIEELSMGRGWRSAQRESEDVTVRMLATAKKWVEGGAQAAASGQGDASAAQNDGLLADSLGLELLAQLGSAPAPLRRAWELALARHPERSASQCLALAEGAILSLLGSGLIVLASTDGSGGTQGQVDEGDVHTLLRSVDSWTGQQVSVARR
ncbi:MAG TPA: hypothetical protein VIC06_01130 [Solirubrobacteraceae bacterium]